MHIMIKYIVHFV